MPNWWRSFVVPFTPETSQIYAAAPTQKVYFAGEDPVRVPPRSYSLNSEKNGERDFNIDSEKRGSWPISSMKDQLQIDLTEISSPEDVSSTKKSNFFDKITRAADKRSTTMDQDFPHCRQEFGIRLGIHFLLVSLF
jgi:low-affinity ferrous iron transport protein